MKKTLALIAALTLATGSVQAGSWDDYNDNWLQDQTNMQIQQSWSNLELRNQMTLDNQLRDMRMNNRLNRIERKIDRFDRPLVPYGNIGGWK